MKVIKVTPRGYCKGVMNAINIVSKTIAEYPDQKIHLLGNIIHNGYVKTALLELGVNIHDSHDKSRLELLAEVDAGVIVFSAHGVSDEVRQLAADKGLTVVDASCVDVLKTQKLIKEYLQAGYTIFYIGKHGHPEAEAMLSLNPQRVHLLEEISDIPPDISGRTLLSCQTTMSIHDVRSLAKEIIRQYPDIEYMEEICNATRIRQEAVMKLDPQEVDMLIVVGDKHSNNTQSLYKIAQDSTFKKVIMIESLKELADKELTDVETVAVTAGASTPSYIVEMLIDYLENYPHLKKETVDYTKVL